MSFKALSVHAHFYQPPREDPLTGVIPVEPGASPFPNWNERIHAECYRPNAELGNFANISFNIGPTLHEWMARTDQTTSQLIIAQDQNNTRRWGVGNAMAQAYNHTILPLASYPDKVCQVTWGIADFSHRFGRKPQGMWLPETAVDIETLEVLANQGIQYTILAPWQAELPGVDVTEPYRVSLPSGHSIVIFFYHYALSGGISFNPNLTIDADYFVQNNLTMHYMEDKEQRGEAQILLLASDGELYGHHQPFRDRFLARLVDGASSITGIQPIYPALWLQKNPVRHEMRIRERTSWSCHHGVERWRGICPCTPGDSSWKGNLRSALDQLAAALDDVYIRTLTTYISDPWELRNQYIHVLLGEQTIENLISYAAGGRLDPEVQIRIHLLLEAQRERQRMYTSCGFFFDDLDRIEPKNNLAYAAHVVRLVRLATGQDLAPIFNENLKSVVSWRSGVSASQIFRKSMYRATMDGRVIAGNFQGLD